MSALQLDDYISLVFTKVVDATALGMPDDDEEVQATTDRAYWKSRASKDTVALADDMLGLVHTFAPDIELKYNKFYIGLAKEGQPNNFVIFYAKKNSFRAEIRLPESPEISHELEVAGIEVMDYEPKWGRYRLRLTRSDLRSHRELLLRLLRMAYGIDAIKKSDAAQPQTHTNQS